MSARLFSYQPSRRLVALAFATALFASSSLAAKSLRLRWDGRCTPDGRRTTTWRSPGCCGSGPTSTASRSRSSGSTTRHRSTPSSRKNIDACTMTNMEALDMPAASGVPTHGDPHRRLLQWQRCVAGSQNGPQLQGSRRQEDAAGGEDCFRVFVRSRDDHQRACATRIKQMRLINTSDSDIASAFLDRSRSLPVVVTWKPIVSQILQAAKESRPLFNSSQIPGEILDLHGGADGSLERPDGSGQKFAKALAGAWYEMMAQMSGPGRHRQGAGCDRGGVRRTRLPLIRNSSAPRKMFYTPKSARGIRHVRLTSRQKMALVRQFCFASRPAREQNEIGRTTSPSDIPMEPFWASPTASACAST